MNPKRWLLYLNLANQLTFLRLVAVPFFLISVLQSRFGLAFVLFGLAAITDLLDGLIARYFKQQTPLGAYLDPAADKLMMTAAFLLLTDYPLMFKSIAMAFRIPIWLTILTISRDVLIVCVALILYLTHHQRRFEPSLVGKWTTVMELLTVCLFLLFNWVGRNGFELILDLMVWTTLALTLISGFHYLSRTIRMLSAGGSGTAASVESEP